jgi:ribonuclease HI
MPHHINFPALTSDFLPVYKPVKCGITVVVPKFLDCEDQFLNSKNFTEPNTTIPIFNFSKYFNVVIDAEYWRNKDPLFPEDVLVWYTDSSRTDSATGSGIKGIRPNRGYCFPLGKYATVFQTEIYAILQCAYENIRTTYRNKRILIFSDSQAALMALNGPKVTSRLVAECLDALSALTDHNKVTLIWVLGHRVICGNEQADKLYQSNRATETVLTLN